MSNNSSALVERLRLYCLSKSASSPSITFGRVHPSYHISGFRYFAKFYLDEDPVRLQLRCTLSDLESPPHGVRLQISQKIRWGGQNWKWTDVWLDEKLDDAVFIRLLDKSHALCMEELDPIDVSVANIADQSSSLQDAIYELIDLCQLEHLRHEIDALIQPAILLHTYPVEEENDLTLGQSKIGGVPDFPAHWNYPTFDGLPLGFLAQINLQEIPELLKIDSLPKSGILYFFSVFGWETEDGIVYPEIPWHRSKEPGFSKVLYYSGSSSSLKRLAKPTGIKTFKPAAVRFESILSLPRASDYVRDPAVENLAWSEFEFEALDDLYFAFEFVLMRKLGFTPKHQLLGYPGAIQFPLSSGETRLLCQIDSDYRNLDTDMMWGDGGRIYFMITQADLSSKNFTQIYSDLQSG